MVSLGVWYVHRGLNYSGLTRAIDQTAAHSILQWLARFHSAHWGEAKCAIAVEKGLQPQGTFWYLDTRNSEFRNIPQRGEHTRAHPFK